MSTLFRSLALRGAASILRRRTPTTLGIRFPEGEETGLRGKYDFSLYDGAAGVGLVLQDLAAATGDRSCRDVAEEVRLGLLDSTSTDPLPPGLYTGFGGVALLHLSHARLRRDPGSLEQAVALGGRLARADPPCADLLSGAAGMGLLQLALFHSTGDEAFLMGARRAAEYLADTAVKDSPGLAWNPGLDEDLQPGLAHGVAGPCLFLVHLAAAGGGRAVARLQREGFRWLEARSVPVGANGLTWPHFLPGEILRFHWCHGAVGVARAYLALHRLTGETRPLEMARAAAEAAWQGTGRGKGEPTCHCHGRSGSIELFLDLSTAGIGGPWRHRAEKLALGLLPHAELRTGAGRLRQGASTLGGLGPGLGMGTAGVVRELMRLAGDAVSPILDPDRGRIETLRPPSPRRGAKITPPELPRGDFRSLLPAVAAPLRDPSLLRGRRVVVGWVDQKSAGAILRALARRPAGGAYFDAFRRFEEGSARLARKHAGLLAAGALSPATFGPLLREVAGLALRPGADPRRMGRLAAHWSNQALGAMGVMLSRLERDGRGTLRGEVDGPVTHVGILGGDPHRGGQRVVELRFREGPTLLYKARSLAIDREIAGATGAGETPTLADQARMWLRPSVAGGALPTHGIIPAGRWHGYAERILEDRESLPTDLEVELFGATAWARPAPQVARLRPGEERRYWYSAGLLAGHALSLGLSDLHVENLVCGRSRSSPELALHAVDLEIAFALVEDLRDTGLAPDRRPGADPEAHSHAGLEPSLHLHCGMGAEDWVLALTREGVQPLPLPRQAVAWSYPHLVQNGDGSWGYAREMGPFLRGMADQWWALRTHRKRVAEHLRSALAGVPARLIAKPTRSYHLLLEGKKIGRNGPATGVSGPEWPLGLPLLESEMRQMDAMDYPYFFRYMETERGAPVRWRWLDPGSGRVRRAPELDGTRRVHAPFWTIVNRQNEERFARALVDAVRVVAPKGPFDLHDRELGVRAFRAGEDERIVIVVLLGEDRDTRLTCRAGEDDVLELRID